MKYYETSYEDYLASMENYQLHPEIAKLKFPKQFSDFKNLIVYGPSGVGKYTQVLSILQKYSSSKLKYDKKISIANEKQEKKTVSTPSVATTTSTTTNTKNIKPITTTKKSTTTSSTVQIKKDKKQEYMYRISDIHYEIDMATLGCNSKLLWHDLFFQIVDIVSVKPEKTGIILCKNFHMIHNELLEIFYSYIRHPLQHINIQLKFIIITEHIGFIPDNIVNACQIISVARPTKEQYIKMTDIQSKQYFHYPSPLTSTIKSNKSVVNILNQIDLHSIVNIKEIHSFSMIKNVQDVPLDVFNIITDEILSQILKPETLKITELRNHLYDLLIYNVDISECVWHLIMYFIDNQLFHSEKDITDTIQQTYVFFKYYNNNYRSIYHLESIVLFLLKKIHYPTTK